MQRTWFDSSFSALRKSGNFDINMKIQYLLNFLKKFAIGLFIVNSEPKFLHVAEGSRRPAEKWISPDLWLYQQPNTYKYFEQPYQPEVGYVESNELNFDDFEYDYPQEISQDYASNLFYYREQSELPELFSDSPLEDKYQSSNGAHEDYGVLSGSYLHHSSGAALAPKLNNTPTEESADENRNFVRTIELAPSTFGWKTSYSAISRCNAVSYVPCGSYRIHPNVSATLRFATSIRYVNFGENTFYPGGARPYGSGPNVPVGFPFYHQSETKSCSWKFLSFEHSRLEFQCRWFQVPALFRCEESFLDLSDHRNLTFRFCGSRKPRHIYDIWSGILSLNFESKTTLPSTFDCEVSCIPVHVNLTDVPEQRAENEENPILSNTERPEKASTKNFKSNLDDPRRLVHDNTQPKIFKTHEILGHYDESIPTRGTSLNPSSGKKRDDE